MPSARSTAPDELVGGGNAFSVELKRWRDVKGLSRTALAARMDYHRSYVSKVESAAEAPSKAFAKRADEVLEAGGALRRAYAEYENARPARPAEQPPAVDPASSSTASSLVVDHDDATLRLEGRTYRLTQRRRLVNNGAEPVSRYLIRISVDRYPGDPDRSNTLYSNNPLTWEEIGLRAWAGQDRDEPMDWTIHHDKPAFKEIWLLFANDATRFPLYPGEATWIEYEYTVSAEHWGNWFQRAVRLPTNTLSVTLDIPAELQPAVWGLETSMTAEAMPFRTAITRADSGDRCVFSWATKQPPLHARYRLEWDFRAHSEGVAGRPRPPVKPSELMAELGIVQQDDPRLRAKARPFELPQEAEDARRVIAQLTSAASRVAQAHVFGKGMGLAAPQIGIDRAAAIVATPDGETRTLLNPRIVEASQETDTQYEGCLSFFDVRGQVSRPLVIHVEHTDIDGAKRITAFEKGAARLAAHEIDHLTGNLYTDRLAPGVTTIPVEQYDGTGTAWAY